MTCVICVSAWNANELEAGGGGITLWVVYTPIWQSCVIYFTCIDFFKMADGDGDALCANLQWARVLSRIRRPHFINSTSSPRGEAAAPGSDEDSSMKLPPPPPPANNTFLREKTWELAERPGCVHLSDRGRPVSARCSAQTLILESHSWPSTTYLTRFEDVLGKTHCRCMYIYILKSWAMCPGLYMWCRVCVCV